MHANGEPNRAVLGSQDTVRGSSTILGIVEDLARASATFVIATALCAGMEVALFGSAITSDDPWILGALIGAIVATISLVLRVSERLASRRAAVWAFATIYSALAIYVSYVFATAELFGPGLAVVVFVSSLTLNTLEILVSRRIRAFHHIATGLILALLWAVAFLLV